MGKPLSPRAFLFCLFLFLASSIITFTLRSSHHHPRALKNGEAHVKTHSAKPRYAFATFLAGNPMEATATTGSENDSDDDSDGYFLGARVLAYQLLHSPVTRTNASIHFLVICTSDVAERKRKRLTQDGATVIVVDKLESSWVTPAAARWRDVMTKLRLWELEQYTKICFIDADTLVTKQLDGVFFDTGTLIQGTLGDAAQIKEDESALPQTYVFASHADYFGYEHAYPPDATSVQTQNYLNCGFFVFTPSKIMFEYYLSLLQLPGRFDPAFPEQNLLNYAHRREGNMPWQPLWYGWNVNWPTEKDWRAGAASFHAKYWDGDPSHDKTLKAIWREQKAEMEGFHRGRALAMRKQGPRRT